VPATLLDDLGKLTLKNIERPVQAFRRNQFLGQEPARESAAGLCP